MIQILCKLFQRLEEEETSQLIFEAIRTLMPKPDKDFILFYLFYYLFYFSKEKKLYSYFLYTSIQENLYKY